MKGGKVREETKEGKAQERTGREQGEEGMGCYN